MPTILREGGFSICINTDDHEPPHVHVYKAGTEVKIDLMSLAVKRRRGMPLREALIARDIVSRYVQRLVAAWEVIHGEGSSGR